MTTELEAAAVALNNGAGEPVKTLLDEFAMAALTGEIASFSTEESCLATAQAAEAEGRNIEQQVAFNAYSMADAMMAEKLRRVPAAAPEKDEADKCRAIRRAQKNGAVMTEADIRFLQVMACNYPAWFDETAAEV